ncbi:MAG: hypothetical protein U9O64_06405 [Campylobacterota bacterium]|nr:hypothetical protein [Campylobacterota bacterium]
MRFIILYFMLFSYMYGSTESLKTLYDNSRSSMFVPLPKEHLLIAEACFEAAFREGGMGKKCQEMLALQEVHIDRDTLVIQEVSLQGRGFYVIKFGKKKMNFISIPHSYHDRKTGQIGLKMIGKNNFRAAAFNTVHRHVMDAAHTEGTLFNAFHLAFAKVYKSESIYQLHGFGQKNRLSVRGKKSAVIVSNGKIPNVKRCKYLCQCFEKLESVCSIFGIDVDELGGISNTQFRTLQKRGYFDFFHIELNLENRERLNRKRELREGISECLLQVGLLYQKGLDDYI